MNAFLAARVFVVWLLPAAIGATWLLLERALPTTEEPRLEPSGVRWQLRHVSRPVTAILVYGTWVAGLAAGALALRWGSTGGFAGALAAGAMALSVGSALVAARFHAELRADAAGLVAARPWPFRTRRWAWSEVDRVTTAPGRLVVDTWSGERTALRGVGSEQGRFDEVARWLDQRAATREPGPTEIPPELTRTRAAARKNRATGARQR